MKREMAKNNITEAVFILDASGSMYDLKEDTIGGFNSLIEEQKGKDGKVLVSTIVFSDDSTVVHDRVEIGEVKKLTEAEYTPCGCTALIDAIGGAVKHISKVHKYIRSEDVPDSTIFFITTDGMENASHKYSSTEVKKMIEAKKEEGWEFIFMGANIDSVETAASFGIGRDRTVNYRNDGRGNAVKFRAMAHVVESVRAGCAVPESWSKEIEEDFESRK